MRSALVPDRGGAGPPRTEPLEDGEGPSEDLEAGSGPLLVAYLGPSIHVVPLDAGTPVVLGRSAPATLVVPDPKLSREHARFSRSGDGVLVRDLGSRNGTWSRGERVETALLAPGDEVLAGGTLVRARGAGPVPPVPAGDAYLAGPAMRPLLDKVARVAASRIPVVLHGETGSGKEVIAELLHTSGPRRAEPFLRVNCAAIPAQLVEATLFGHERGSYTGAHQQQRGVFEEANGGTVFLDEIGELNPAAQASMLRVLETGSFTRVGSPREIKVDVRVIAATHRSLQAMVSEGLFREDLYYRLNAVTLEIPPLRARPSDVEPIARRLVSRAAEAAGRAVRGLSGPLLSRLERHDWPGNVRELKNTIDQMVVLARGDVLRTADLPVALRGTAEPAAPALPAAPPPHGKVALSAGRSVPPDAPAEDDDDGGELRSRVQQYEARLIQDALRSTGGNKTEAARLLGLPIRTLTRRIKQLDIKETPGED
jgi:two-component system response regulator AtoC